MKWSPFPIKLYNKAVFRLISDALSYAYLLATKYPNKSAILSKVNDVSDLFVLIIALSIIVILIYLAVYNYY